MSATKRDWELKTIVDALSKKLVDDGKLIAAGFHAYEVTVMPRNALPLQRSECELAYFAGAQHLFGSIMSVLDVDAEPTESDLRRMSQIDSELRAFVEKLKLRVATPGGSA